jgi:hypothetical protein
VAVTQEVVRAADGGQKDVAAIRSIHEAAQTQAQLRGLLEVMPDAVVVMNQPGRFRAW